MGDDARHRGVEGAHMDAATTTGQKAPLSDYLAAERTLLAWIRTGLAASSAGSRIRQRGDITFASNKPGNCDFVCTCGRRHGDGGVSDLDLKLSPSQP
jgi:hypothetical protein